MAKFQKGQIIGAQSPYKGADINKAPGYPKPSVGKVAGKAVGKMGKIMKMKKSLNKKGLQTNYSK